MRKALPSDNLLLEQFKAGEPNAFKEIYNSYVAELLEYAAQRLSSLEEARDMVQDIFLNLYERRAQLQIKVSLRTYLFAALKYKIIDHIRKNVHREYYADLLQRLPVKTEDSLFNNLVYNDLNDIVEKEVLQLPTRIRETFLLSRQKHLTVSEIAEHMNVSEQTVKNQLTTALNRLRPILNKVMLLCILFFFFQ